MQRKLKVFLAARDSNPCLRETGAIKNKALDCLAMLPSLMQLQKNKSLFFSLEAAINLIFQTLISNNIFGEKSVCSCVSYLKKVVKISSQVYFFFGSFICLFVYSFLCLFLPLFICLLVHLFVGLFIRSFLHLLVFFIHLFVRSFHLTYIPFE